MNIHEGEELKKRLKASFKQMNELPAILDMTSQNINYHLRKEKLDIEFARKVREKTGVFIDENGGKSKFRMEAIPRNVMPDREEFEGNDHKFAYSDEGIVAMRVKVVPAKAQLGYLRGYADPEWFADFDYEIIPVEIEHRSTYLGFETTGYSMVNTTTDQWAEKSIFPRRIAIGRELDRSKWKDKLHIHTNDAWIIVHKDGVLLKEIIEHDPKTGVIKIHSWNPDKEQYPDEYLNLEEVAQLFNVLQVVDKRR